MKNSNDVCVYLHLRKRKVFYVGIGSINRSKATRSRPALWYEMCPDKIFTIKIYRQGLSKDQAEKLELRLVEDYMKKGYKLANSPILTPGLVAIDVLGGEAGKQNSRLGERSLNVPWLMLDSFSSAGQPFRMQITFKGETKRMFASTLPDLFNDICRHFGHAYEPKEFASADRLIKLIQIRDAFDFLINKGAKAFLENYAEPKRHSETLSEYINENQVDWRHGAVVGDKRADPKDRYYHSGPPMKSYPPCTNWPTGPRAFLVRFINKVAKLVPKHASVPASK
jgi:hypothetical protein